MVGQPASSGVAPRDLYTTLLRTIATCTGRLGGFLRTGHCIRTARSDLYATICYFTEICISWRVFGSGARYVPLCGEEFSTTVFFVILTFVLVQRRKNICRSTAGGASEYVNLESNKVKKKVGLSRRESNPDLARDRRGY